MIKQGVSIPKKMKDPGSCTIPCHVGSEDFNKALCDLRSRTSLILTSGAISYGSY